MRIVIAPNAFKGSLSALEAATAIGDGIRIAVPDADLVLVPIADGGDGTGAALGAPNRRDPRTTTTYGVGELLQHAYDAGSRHFIVGIGGSATNDGGAGMAQALGYHLLDESGHELPPGGLALKRLAGIHVGGGHAD